MADLPAAEGGPSVSERKYIALYGVMAQVIAAVAGGQAAAPEARFELIKDLMPGLWWGVMAGRFAQTGLTLEVLQAFAAKYNTAPCVWAENGVRQTGTNAGYHRAEERSARDYLLRYAPADCDLVLDLGCGWGHRMFDLWRGGGPANALYVGGDRPEGSQACIASVAGLFPGMRVHGLRFDFRDPDFSTLPRDARSVLVYSTQAIEQVEPLGPRLFDELLRTFPKARIVGVHQEPVGFQMPAWQARDPARCAQDRAYAAKKIFNQDLYAQVLNHPALECVTAVPGVIDFVESISRALLVWRKKPASVAS